MVRSRGGGEETTQASYVDVTCLYTGKTQTRKRGGNVSARNVYVRAKQSVLRLARREGGKEKFTCLIADTPLSAEG